MKSKILTSSYPIYYSLHFAKEVERVISKNCDVGTSMIVQEVGYFISKLDIGIQQASSIQLLGDTNGLYTYYVEGIGRLYLRLVKDNNGVRYIFIDNIEWDFKGYYLYPHLTEMKHPKIEKLINLMERIEHLGECV